MSPADRQKLLADVKGMDEAASVALSMPETARPGQEVSITATEQPACGDRPGNEDGERGEHDARYVGRRAVVGGTIPFIRK
jgi:hypothetical protein